MIRQVKFTKLKYRYNMKIFTILTFLLALISAEIQSISSTVEDPIQKHKNECSSKQDQLLFWVFLRIEKVEINFWLA